MKFIVEPQKEEKQEKKGPITMCYKCSEYPPACIEI